MIDQGFANCSWQRRDANPVARTCSTSGLDQNLHVEFQGLERSIARVPPGKGLRLAHIDAVDLSKPGNAWLELEDASPPSRRHKLLL